MERALHPLQDRTPFDGRIIAVEKLVTIHTVSSTAFSGEPGKFREVRTPKVSCTVHKLSFDIYIDYVSRKFEKHVLQDRIVNLNIVSICVQS